MKRISDIRDQLGCSMLIIEQKVRQVLEITDRVVSMKLGRIVFSGDGEDFRRQANELLLS